MLKTYEENEVTIINKYLDPWKVIFYTYTYTHYFTDYVTLSLNLKHKYSSCLTCYKSN